MTEFKSSIPLPFIPDDLTVPQFLLDDYKHPLSEMRKGDDAIWLIDDTTGREYTFKEASNLTVVAREMADPLI